MKKRSWANILFRIALMIIATPIVVIGVLILLLYIPPVQRAVVEKTCEEIGEMSGYDVSIGSITLSFPLRLKTTEFSMSKDDSVYFQGKRLDAHVSFMPLLTGKVEVNYLSIEGLDVDTRDIMPDMRVDGKVGFVRVVARDADLKNSVAYIRQLHVADTDLNITMADTTVVSEESEPLPWIIKLRRGSIKNSRIGLSIPHDTLSAGVYIENMLLGRGRMDISSGNFAVRKFIIANSTVEYNKGGKSQQEAPLDHIRLEKINLDAKALRYTDINNISANITQFTVEQPGGIAITDAAMRFTSSNDTLRLHKLDIRSRNGSYIHGESTIPLPTLLSPGKEQFTATLAAGVSKPDLARLVTGEVYGNLHYFDRQMLEADISLGGNICDIAVDTLVMKFPTVGALYASGSIKDILDEAKRECRLDFGGELDDIKKFIACDNDSIDGRATTRGHISYAGDRIDADITLHNANGHIDATAGYSIADTTYHACIAVNELSLTDIMPDIPLHSLAMRLKAEGSGVDLFSNRTSYDINIAVDTLHYAGYRLHAINAKATQANNVSLIEVEGNDSNLLFDIDATTRLSHAGIDNRTTIELTGADLRAIGLVDSTLKTSTTIDIAAATDFRETHSLRVAGEEINIITKKRHFTPENLSLDFATSPTGTSISMHNGDLDIDGEMDCGYKRFFASMGEIARMNEHIMNGKNTLYHLEDYEKVLPRISLDFSCGQNNIMHNFLAFTGIETEKITIDADISKSRGLNINGNITGFSSGDISLDSIKFATRQNKKGKLYYIMGGIGLNIASLNEANNHNALLYGNILRDTVTTNIALRDNIGDRDSKISFATHLTPGNMNIRFNPEALLFGAPFTFSRNNYINIGKAMSVSADVTFSGGNNDGLRLYTTPDDKAKYNITLDLFNIFLSKITDALPGIPSIGGNLFAELNYRQDGNGDTFTCDVDVNKLTYEGNGIGDECVKLVYSPKENGMHGISCTISHDKTQVADIRSDYRQGRFKGKVALTRLPLNITQAFIDKEGVIIDGYLNSKIDFAGTLSNMKSHGYMQFDSVYAYSPMLGALLHPSDEMIMIENNKVNLQKFHIYDKANTPFVINGNIDISNLLNPKLSLILNAANYEIMNNPRDAGKMVYGKMYVDLRSMIRGTLDNISMLGNLTILSNSNFAYVLPETAFDSNKDLDGLVEFVNFNDTTAVKQLEETKIDLGNINANLNVTVKEGVKMSVDLDSSRENYVSIEGDGNLNAVYNKNGISVTGIYNLSGGQLKLTLPIIPLKTFYIQEGGRLTWTGDLFNPTMDVTAMEKTTASVEMEDNSIQPVDFNAGVKVSNNINNLAIDFTMSAPDNSVIQNQLNELDKETMSRYAVAMIITGTYLGGRQGVTAANALSSFLDAKINEISGNAIKNFDVNIGINDALNAETGNAYTNYSFSFSKRFFNDRITVVIGGEVNSGDRPDRSAGNNTFINNISLEWKLNNAGNRYIRIFYDKNYQSLLEGEITETGVGYVYKRKLNSLKELFTFRRKNKKNTPIEPQRAAAIGKPNDTTNHTREKQ